MDTVIIGQGTWGKRLASACAGPVRTWTHGEAGFAIEQAERIYVAVPVPYLRETLDRFAVDPEIPVISCAKGLDETGRLPSDVIRLVWRSKTVIHLGGPCVCAEEIVVPEYGGKDIELVSALKNVYAIGFNELRERQGINVAAAALAAYLDELGPARGGISDLLATCFSPDSRNARAGIALARNEKPDLRGEVAEGLHTARVIERLDLYKDKYRLRQITRLIAGGRQ